MRVTHLLIGKQSLHKELAECAVHSAVVMTEYIK